MSHGSGAAMQMGGGMYAVRHVNLRRTCPCLMVVDLGFVMQGVGIAKDIVREASEAMSVMRDTSSEIPVRNASRCDQHDIIQRLVFSTSWTNKTLHHGSVYRIDTNRKRM